MTSPLEDTGFTLLAIRQADPLQRLSQFHIGRPYLQKHPKEHWSLDDLMSLVDANTIKSRGVYLHLFQREYRGELRAMAYIGYYLTSFRLEYGTIGIPGNAAPLVPSRSLLRVMSRNDIP